MGNDTVLSSACSNRVVAYFDVDCFYAQAEVLRRPHLQGRPVGVTQKFLVVTCNYEARQQGVPKMVSIQAAKERCPDLVLFNGEDLTPYRAASKRIMAVLGRFGVLERRGLDEAALDISVEVMKRFGTVPICEGFSGHVLGQKCMDDNESEVSAAWRADRSNTDDYLMVGTHLVAEIRAAVEKETGFRCSSGIATNKMLAKLVSSINKPNKQTCILETALPGFLMPLHVRKLPGIGHQTESVLKEMGITTVADLQQATLQQLSTKFGQRMGTLLFDNCRGVDKSLVQDKGPPKSLSVEDSFQPCASFKQAEEIIRSLAPDLVSRLDEDRDEYSRRPKAFTVKWRHPGNWAFRSSSAPMPLEALSVCVPQEQRLEILVETAMKLLSQSLGRQPFSIVVLNIGATSFTCSSNGSCAASQDIRSFLSTRVQSTKQTPSKIVSKREARVNREQSEKGRTDAKLGDRPLEMYENVVGCDYLSYGQQAQVRDTLESDKGEFRTDTDEGDTFISFESDEGEFRTDTDDERETWDLFDLEQQGFEQSVPFEERGASMEPSTSNHIPFGEHGASMEPSTSDHIMPSLAKSCGLTDVAATDYPPGTSVPLMARSTWIIAPSKDISQKRLTVDLNSDSYQRMVDSTAVQDHEDGICEVCGQNVGEDPQSRQEHSDYHYALDLHARERSLSTTNSLLNTSSSPRSSKASQQKKASTQALTPKSSLKKRKRQIERAGVQNSTLDCFVYRARGE